MREIVIILQARTASTRLPAKVLLPLAGIPLAVLAARRAANTGLHVVVATSDRAGDDGLVKLVEKAGFSCVRGPEEDVLQRFLLSTQEYNDATSVVRLTADNTFPDGAFVEELCARFAREGSEYLGTHSPDDGLPYGLSAEVFRLQALRHMAPQATPADREHVTASLRRGRVPFRPESFSGNLSGLRCTVDCLEDYQRIASIFETVDDPVRVTWRELVMRLNSTAPRPRCPAHPGEPELVIGTAQLGLPHYGRTNITGRPHYSDALTLVRSAVSRGVAHFDTARAYGEAERVLGEALVPFGQIPAVTTKLDPLAHLGPNADPGQVRDAVDASIFRSCRELRRSTLPSVLVHRWSHRRAWGQAAWLRLRELQSEGVIGRLGGSVYTPEEAQEALSDAEIQHLQLPLNILDTRWLAAGIDRLAAGRPDVTLHARSLFLQGLLLHGAHVWPRIEGVDPRRLGERLDHWVKLLGRRNRMDLCLAFGRVQTWIGGLVLGVDSQAQMEELVNLINTPAISQDEAARMAGDFIGLPTALLNPALWPSPTPVVSEMPAKGAK